MKNEIFVIYLDNNNIYKYGGKQLFIDREKAENYLDNVSRHLGRMMHLHGCWYEMTEEEKQPWIDKARERLSIRTYTLKEDI